MLTLWMLIIIWSLGLCTGEESIIRLKGCKHKLTIDGYISSECICYVSSDISAFPIRKKTQGFLIKNLLKSQNPVSNSSKTIRMGLDRVTIEKLNDGLQSSDNITYFRFKEWLHVSTFFIKKMYCTANFSNNLIVGQIVSPKGSVRECLNGVNCSLSVIVKGKYYLDGLSSVAMESNFRRNFKRNFQIFLSKWNITTSNSVFEIDVSFRHLGNINIISIILEYCISQLNLSRLSIEDSDIKNLGDSSLYSFTDLKSLSFSANKLSALNDDVFKYLRKLQHLDFSQNSLHSVPKTVFLLPSLISLDLSGNTPKDSNYFEVQQASQRSSLKSTIKYLYLSSTKLTYLTIDSFSNFPNLTHLEVKNCSIIEIHPEAFFKPKQLGYLDLSLNFFETFDSDTLQHLNDLQFLNIGYNKLRDRNIKVKFLENFPNLKSLKIDGNQLTKINFIEKTAAIFIDLSKNHIEPWGSESYLEEEMVQTKLILQENRLDYITPSMLADFQKFSLVDLANNPFDCNNCNFKEFQKWIINDTILYNSNTYVCAKPPKSEGKLLKLHHFQNYGCLGLDYRNIIMCCITLIIIILIVAALIHHFRWKIMYLVLRSRSKVRKALATPGNNGYVYDAFVCFSDKDQNWVSDRLVPELEHNKDNRIRLCIHHRDFLAGVAITDNIVGNLSKSRKILLIVSQGYLKSRWCLFETHMAQHRMFEENRDSIIVILLNSIKDVDTPSHVNYLLKTRTYLKWSAEPTKQSVFWLKLRQLLLREDVLKYSSIP